VDAKSNSGQPTPTIGGPAVPPPAIIPDLPPLSAGVQAGPQPIKLVNNRSIELDFDITKTGRSKIRSVELWATRNRGATWQKMDQLMGCESPFATRLTSEGTYGFKLVFQSESGRQTKDPAPGEEPDVSLELDTTPPVISLFEPVAVPGQPGKVRLRWQATDAHLDSTSVRVEYSTDGTDWNPIVAAKSGLEAGAHSYDWTIPRTVPPRVLLRVTARDLAGNVGSAQTNDKVAIDLVAPEGKIKRVRVAVAEPENGPLPRVVDSSQVLSFWVGFIK